MNDQKITSLAEAKEEELYAFNRERYGDVIRRFRMEKGFNQPQLAEMAALCECGQQLGSRQNAAGYQYAARSM
ncbi:MAG: hypothetical protein IJE08_11935 [Clostridia bacterium]|nr:hypothetical protein [Clostridia bacterium]